MKHYMLSTIDNPFDYSTQFEDWFRFDTIENSYNSCGKLARMLVLSDQMTDEEVEALKEEAIDKIVKYDPFGKFIKIEVNDDDED